MGKDHIRIGVVGAGSMGRNHARVLASLPGVTLAGVCDAEAKRAREIAAEFGSTAFTSLDDLLPQIDAAAVATPTVTHLELGLRLLEAGKHVFVEKPITETADGARQLIEKARATRRILQVGHIERFNPVIRELEKRLTRPRFIEAHRLSPFPNRSTDIGVVLDLMIHDLEIILHLVKSEIASIDAVGIPVLTKREDIANARLRFRNGCVANLTTSRISPERMRKIRVFQDDAYLSLDYQNQTGEIIRKAFLGLGIKKEPVKIEKDEPLRLELAAFAECARLGRHPQVGGQEAAAALELALQITQLIEGSGDRGGGVLHFDSGAETPTFFPQVYETDTDTPRPVEVHSATGMHDHLSAALGFLGANGAGLPTLTRMASPARTARFRAEADLLRDWGAAHGLVLDPAWLRQFPFHDWGHEHYVFLDLRQQRVVKITYPDQAGHDRLSPPVPSEYFERLRLQNEVFADDVRLEGFLYHGATLTIVTSQPFVRPDDEQPHPTPREIEDWLRDLGFIYQSGAYWRKVDRLAMDDLHSANVIREPGGTLVPIDVKLRRLPEPPV